MSAFVEPDFSSPLSRDVAHREWTVKQDEFECMVDLSTVTYLPAEDFDIAHALVRVSPILVPMQLLVEVVEPEGDAPPVNRVRFCSTTRLLKCMGRCAFSSKRQYIIHSFHF